MVNRAHLEGVGVKMYWRSLFFAALITTPAHSADLLRPSLAHEDWTGFRVGIEVGSANTNGKTSLGRTEGDLINLDVTNGLFPHETRGDAQSATVSLSAGYDKQFGDLVAGVEVDVSSVNLGSFFTQNRRDPNPNPPFTGVQTIPGYHTKFENVATARVRLGRGIGKSLIYATGGFAVGKVVNRTTLHIPELGYSAPDWKSDKYKTGWVLGAGFEHKLTRNLRLKLEWQYIDLADSTVVGTDPVNFPGQRLDYKYHNTMNIGKVGLGWTF